MLARVSLGLDPWSGTAGQEEALATWRSFHGGGTRLVSQALGRLRRKGFLRERPGSGITMAGEHALELAFIWAMYHRRRP